MAYSSETKTLADARSIAGPSGNLRSCSFVSHFQEVEGRGGLYKLLNAMKNVNFSQAISRQRETLVLVLRR